MTTATPSSPTLHEPQLLGKTVVLIGGSAGIGLETARLARVEGAGGVLNQPQPGAPPACAFEVDAVRSAAFDAALPVDLMTNTAITGATCDIDGGQQLLEA